MWILYTVRHILGSVLFDQKLVTKGFSDYLRVSFKQRCLPPGVKFKWDLDLISFIANFMNWVTQYMKVEELKVNQRVYEGQGVKG